MCEGIIYMDYAADTPVDKEVLKSFEESTIKYLGNPNSTHILGIEAKKRIEVATSTILDTLKKYANLEDETEIIYTSGASESNNLAIKGISSAYRERGKHIISTFIEHPSVSSPLTYLKELGFEVDLLNLKRDGKVDIEQLKELMREDTILVSICYIDSELGTIQPIEEISKIVKEYKNCYLHVDCTQAIGKMKVNLESIDLVSFAPHKFYGLNGIGGLIKRKNIVLDPLINGGSSISIYRSGTPVTGLIVSMEKAIEMAFKNLDNRFKHVEKLNEKLYNELLKYKNVNINSGRENPYIINLSVRGVKATDFKLKLEENDICISIKSACGATVTPSRAVMAISHDRKLALSSWRISLSHLTTEEEIERFLSIFKLSYQYFLGGE